MKVEACATMVGRPHTDKSNELNSDIINQLRGPDAH